MARVEPSAGPRAELRHWREQMEAMIASNASLGEEDRADLKMQIAKIGEEAAKEGGADSKRLERLVNVLMVMAPDVFEIAIATLVSPLAGIGLTFKKSGDEGRVEFQRRG
jgi:hypothetical protein